MPSVSKKQQKFMGIVRAIQKGEEPASKFSKDAQDAAKKMKKSSVKKYAKTKHGDLPVKKESWMDKLGGSYFEEGLQRDRNNLAMYIIDLNNMLSQAKLSKNPKAKKYIKFIQQDIKDAKKKLSKLKEERDYKDEYKKFQSSTKAKKYRAELNKYNRQKGTYGNGDGKDASHKNGKIVGFEKESKNRGRAEKSRLKKEFLSSINPIIDEAIDGLVLEGVDDPGIFKAIFLAGGPGSGKTFVAQKLFGIPETLTTSAKGLKLVNQDTEFEYLLKKYFGTIEIDKFPPDVFADLIKPTDQGGSNLRPFAKELNREKLRLYTKGKLGVIIDGTAHKVDKIKERKKELEDLGYDTYMVFVNTTLEAALERNEDRKRTVPVDVAKKSWNDVQKNMADLKSMFKSNFYMADNSKHLDPEQAEKKFNALVKKGIDKFMKKPIRNKIAKNWVKKQRILKKQGIKESVMVNELSLKKLEDAIKDFKKKIKKQGRVTNARDEDHLERLMKVYNDMGGRKIKENNELFEWLHEACWKGYEKKGMKTMFGKRVPNCVKREHVDFCVNCGDILLDESLNENLKKWFKDKWVRVGPKGKIRGACGGKSKGEGKPKCLPLAKARGMGKKGRASAARRKRRKDPNPNRRGKAINVKTKKK